VARSPREPEPYRRVRPDGPSRSPRREGTRADRFPARPGSTARSTSTYSAPSSTAGRASGAPTTATSSAHASYWPTPSDR
jgi:hypothetical protein